MPGIDLDVYKRTLIERFSNEYVRDTLADASVWPDTIKDPLYEDADTASFRLNRRGPGQRVGGRQVDARFGLRLNGGLWCQRAVHPQPE